MINVTLDKDGESFVHMKGNLKDLIAEGLMVVDMIYQGLHEHNPSDAFAFEHAFYNAAEKQMFFDQKFRATSVVEDSDLTARQKAKKSFIENGVSEETADMLAGLAEKYATVLAKAVQEACDDPTEHIKD